MVIAFSVWFRDGPRLIRILADCAYFLDRRHRHIADVNLRIAFPDLTKEQRSRIARKSFQNTAMNLLEVSKFKSLTPSTSVLWSPMTPSTDSTTTGLQSSEEGHPLPHGALQFVGTPSCRSCTARLSPELHHAPLDNAPFERYLLKVRESKGNRVINKKNSARHILKELSSGSSAGILMDQNTSTQEGMFIDLFGIPAATTTGVALFALRTDAPVLPGYLTPMRNGRYTIKFLPPLDVVRTSDMNHDLRVNTRRFNAILEDIIRDQPESWLWGHKRWKYQPPGNPQDLYALSEQELESFLSRARSGLTPGRNSEGG